MLRLQCMHDLSIGEFDSLVLKAYRGAGFSWGMAQEAGSAAAWLALRGLPAGKYFAQLIKQIDGADPISLTPKIVHGQWQSDHRPLCPVVCGTVLSDHGWKYFAGFIGDQTDPALQLGTIHSPIIILPFLSDCSMASGNCLHVTVDQYSLVVMPNGSWSVSGDCDSKQETGFDSLSAGIIKIRSGSIVQCASPSVCRRIDINDTDLEMLEQYAHRTYVPATEESRMSGAGAGLTDND